MTQVPTIKDKIANEIQRLYKLQPKIPKNRGNVVKQGKNSIQKKIDINQNASSDLNFVNTGRKNIQKIKNYQAATSAALEDSAVSNYCLENSKIKFSIIDQKMHGRASDRNQKSDSRNDSTPDKKERKSSTPFGQHDRDGSEVSRTSDFKQLKAIQSP